MFKVIIPRSKDLTENNIRTGWFNAFAWLGKSAVWLEDGKAPLDLWHEVGPNIVIIKQSELTESIVKAINKYGTTIFLFWECVEQPLVDKIRLKNIYWFQDRLYKPGIGLPVGTKLKLIYPATDTIRFKPGIYREELVADLTYIGTWQPRKAPLLKYLEQESKQRTVRIYGYGSWNHPLHVGVIESDKLYADIIKSSHNIIYCENREKFYNYHYLRGSGEILHLQNDKIWISETTTIYQQFLRENSYIARVQEMLSCIN